MRTSKFSARVVIISLLVLPMLFVTMGSFASAKEAASTQAACKALKDSSPVWVAYDKQVTKTDTKTKQKVTTTVKMMKYVYNTHVWKGGQCLTQEKIKKNITFEQYTREQSQAACKLLKDSAPVWVAYDKQVTKTVNGAKVVSTVKMMKYVVTTHAWSNNKCVTKEKVKRSITLEQYNKEQAKKAGTTTTVTTPTTGVGSSTPGAVTAQTTTNPVSNVLKKGSTGTKVKDLQTKRKKLGYDVVVNSTFDDATEVALKKFQHINGLPETGILDANTKSRLDKAYASLGKIIARLNDNNPKVKTINESLVALGYTPDAGSVYGLNTEAAIKRYQEYKKLPITGITDNTTYSKLLADAKNMNKGIKAGAKKSDIQKYQGYLVRLGYANVPVDGVYGATTLAAVKDFQTKNSLVVNGVINNETKKAIDTKIKELDRKIEASVKELEDKVKADADFQKLIEDWAKNNPGLKVAVTPEGNLVVVK